MESQLSAEITIFDSTLLKDPLNAVETECRDQKVQILTTKTFLCLSMAHRILILVID